MWLHFTACIMNVSQGLEPMTPQLKSSMLTIVHSLLFSFHILSVFLKSTNYCTNRACQAFPTNEIIASCQATTTSSSVFSFLIFNQTVQESTIFSLPNETRGSSCRQNMMRTQYQILFNIYPWRVRNKYYCFDNVSWVHFHQIKP